MRRVPSCYPVRVTLICATALFFAQLVLCPIAGASGSESEVFGTREIFSTNLLPFPKWNDVVSRTAAQGIEQLRLCGEKLVNQACVLPRWRALVAELRKLPMRERITRANEVLNR